MTTFRRSDPAQWDTGALIQALGTLNDEARAAAISVIAHHLTVEVRMLLSEPRPDQRVLDRLRAINEFEHHLTSRIHPDGSRSPSGDMAMLRDIAADAERCGLSAAVKRGLVTAMRNAVTNAKEPIAAH